MGQSWETMERKRCSTLLAERTSAYYVGKLDAISEDDNPSRFNDWKERRKSGIGGMNNDSGNRAGWFGWVMIHKRKKSAAVSSGPLVRY